MSVRVSSLTKDAASPDPLKQARDALAKAHVDVTAATQRTVGDDGKAFLGAAAALDLAVECLMPPHPDSALAAESCHEALELLKVTRAYAQRESGGPMAKVLDETTKRIDGAVKLLRS